jgi:hypothetical protein
MLEFFAKRSSIKAASVFWYSPFPSREGSECDKFVSSRVFREAEIKNISEPKRII